jgi:hypothetical protein
MTIALLTLLCAAADASGENLAARLRHLDSAAEAWSPAPSTGGERVAFLTTLFGTRQAATMSSDGGYPVQLTDEPGGARAVRYVPGPPKLAMVTVMRDGHRRLLLVEEDKGEQTEVDPASGEQVWGGFSRDGKRFFYAVVDGPGKTVLKELALDTRRTIVISPPPPAAGITAPKGSVPLDEALTDLATLGPLSPDLRTLISVTRRGDKQAVYSIDLASARAMLLTPEPGRFSAPQFTPDSHSIYLLTDAGREKLSVDVLTLQTKARMRIFTPPIGELTAYAVSPDGHRLAVAVESGGETLFSLLDLPSLRPQPLAAPPAGALAMTDPGEPAMYWDRGGERLFFGWRLSDDTTDIWALRFNYGTPIRLTRSPRPGLPRDSIPRPSLVKLLDGRSAWLWRPANVEHPRLAVLVSSQLARPVFDKRIAALNFAGLAVLAVAGDNPQRAALDYLAASPELDAHEPILLDFEGLPVDEPSRWSGVVGIRGFKGAGLALDTDVPDLHALVRYASRGTIN